MIVFERFGYTFKVKNSDWRKLKERFDPKNATQSALSKMWRIHRDCPLCLRYPGCLGCSFEGLCKDFFNRIFRTCKFDAHLATEVSWMHSENFSARRQLNRIQKIMDDIENNQKEATCQKQNQKKQ